VLANRLNLRDQLILYQVKIYQLIGQIKLVAFWEWGLQPVLQRLISTKIISLLTQSLKQKLLLTILNVLLMWILRILLWFKKFQQNFQICTIHSTEKPVFVI